MTQQTLSFQIFAVGVGPHQVLRPVLGNNVTYPTLTSDIIFLFVIHV
jgi:hypothetical protein